LPADKQGMIDFSTPLSGMTQAETSVNQIALRVAQPATDAVDLSMEMVALMSARDNYAVDSKVIQAEDQMTQSALSVLA
jgi:flagellar hook protein FlgE